MNFVSEFDTSVVVDGYVGAGKSTLLRKMETITESWLPDEQLTVYPEQVMSWCKYVGYDLLKLYYNHIGQRNSAWAFRLQTKIIRDMIESDRIIRSQLPGTLSIQEKDLNIYKSLWLRLL